MSRSKKKFTFKIIIGYLILVILAIGVGTFIFPEISVFLGAESAMDKDEKLLKTGILLTNIYETESLSKLALQSKTKNNFTEYVTKVDSLAVEIDALKKITQSNYQLALLDSIQQLLYKKVANNNELHNLRVKNKANSTIDKALKEFSSIEASLGKIIPEGLAPNFYELPPKTQSTLREWVEFLNKNVPEEGKQITDAKKVDSILTATKLLLTNAKTQDLQIQHSLSQKEITITQNDIALSQQLQRMVSSFEQEVIINNSKVLNIKKAALKKSIRMAQVASVLGVLIVVVFTFLIIRDYRKVQTYRENLEKEKKYSESLLKSREQLIATVSHDLRTPLNTIMGYSELMEHTQLTGKQKSYLKNMKSAAQYVHNLVNDLLDFSKLEAGKIKIAKTPFVLSQLIVETAENLKEIHKGKPLELIVHIDPKLDTPLLGDPFRIRQILTNLIGNAYKFTHEGYIKVEALVEGHKNKVYRTVIKVSDSGIGIEKEQQERIFKEFAQADEKTEKKYGGYGLGLTISKKLVELLKGTITVASEVKKGSTFTVQFPLEFAKNQPVASDQKKPVPRKNLSILILDDDPSMLRLLQEVCALENSTAHCFTDFSDIETEMNMVYDVVLTDIQMPSTNGFEVLKKLKSSNYAHYTNQPIIAMTGRKDLPASDYTTAGFAKILQKPFTKSSFLEVLGDLFPANAPSPVKQEAEATVRTKSHLFNLTFITSFLGDDLEAINEVLQTFLQDTKTNMHSLKIAMDTQDQAEVNAISHKMLPMFRQLKANEIVPILEKLEVIPAEAVTDVKSLKSIYTQLRHRITALRLALDAHLLTASSCND